MTAALPDKTSQVILSERDTARATGSDRARIDTAGALVCEGSDVGEAPEMFFGRDEYEYGLTVDADWKDTVLLQLLSDGFTTVGQARTWLKERGIPFRWSSWP
jgi:hypothetical protein